MEFNFENEMIHGKKHVNIIENYDKEKYDFRTNIAKCFTPLNILNADFHYYFIFFLYNNIYENLYSNSFNFSKVFLNFLVFKLFLLLK